MEVLLVLVILVVLASMAVTIFSGTQEQAMKDAAKGQIGIIKSAADMYHLRILSYPKSIEDLVNKPSDAKVAEKWAGPYLDRVPEDPWGNKYQIQAPGKHNTQSVDIWSFGPDGNNGSDDDIGNW
jgi:general secretion pathway protein G